MKHPKRIFLFIVLYFIPFFSYSQEKQFITFCKSQKEIIPFVTIKFNGENNGTISNLDGKFFVPNNVTTLEISCLGYKKRKIQLPYTLDTIFLETDGQSLQEVIIKPDKEVIYEVIDKVIKNRPFNNPEKYNWYDCKMYYKMVIDALPETNSISDTSLKELTEIMKSQHLLMTETYSKRYWKYPQRLQEYVIGSRFSGLQKSLYSGLVTDILPFHSDKDFITLNNKDYHSPICSGYKQHYKYKLIDWITSGKDTIWQIAFHPRNARADEMDGILFINSNHYAISHLIAKVFDTGIKRDVSIEQEYQLVNDNGEEKWFPLHLNYNISWTIKTSKNGIVYDLKGTSIIDSVHFKEQRDFKFDKAHSIIMEDGFDTKNDTQWKSIRPIALDNKENTTYKVIDSLGGAFHFDDYMSLFTRLPEGKIHIKKLDFDISRLIAFNEIENIRLGLGVQTSDELLKWMSIGGWFGYGFKDKTMKYGGFIEFYFDKTHEFTVAAGYNNDYDDPGRFKLNPEIDMNYLNYLLLKRVDKIEGYFGMIKKKIGFTTLELKYKYDLLSPLYNYYFQPTHSTQPNFTDQSISLNIKYAFGEHTAPFYGRYYPSGSKYPIFYSNIEYGNINTAQWSNNYVRALAGIEAHKHFNKIGKERLVIKAGKIWGNKDQFPLSKLFAGLGFGNKSVNLNTSYYGFGGLQTMLPYSYYSDQFIGGVLNHEFNWKLFKIQPKKSNISFAPSLALQYGFLSGGLSNNSVNTSILYSTPTRLYSEGGVILNNVIRINYFNILYLTLNIGYFRPAEYYESLNYNEVFTVGLSAEF